VTDPLTIRDTFDDCARQALMAEEVTSAFPLFEWAQAMTLLSIQTVLRHLQRGPLKSRRTCWRARMGFKSLIIDSFYFIHRPSPDRTSVLVLQRAPNTSPDDTIVTNIFTWMQRNQTPYTQRKQKYSGTGCAATVRNNVDSSTSNRVWRILLHLLALLLGPPG
jgi:hypothetical protein